VGLRDGAVLALVAAGLTAVEIAALRATDITVANHQAVVAIHRHRISWCIVLPDDLGGRLLAWLTEARTWGLPELVFQGCRGPLTSMGVWKILDRYRDPQTRRRFSHSRASKQPMDPVRRRAA
jgi:site-specific recombinase XerD